MRLRTNKTFSQHQLAVKLRMGLEGGGWLTFERRRLLRDAAKNALAAACSYWLAKLLHLPDGYWGAISAVIVLQSNVGATVTASRDRLIGTLIGAMFGFSFSLFGGLPWNYFAAVGAAVLVCGLLGLRASGRLAGVTITIVMLVHQQGPRWELPLFRVIEVALGIVVALAVSTFVFPDRARLHLRDGLAQELLLLSAFFETALEGFGSAASANLPALREDVLTRLRSNNLLLQAARNEPSGGPGWREGLGMLAQFGRSIFDALLALDLSVRDSHEDAYAQQLEPELGKLAVDIRSGFHHVARCIHEWRFNVPPRGINLEQDIADLEAKMDTVRHTGAEFSQAEILRAYAIQLHLKQIARRLRAARVETSRAIGESESAATGGSEQPS
jgi:uncharacterized membrane protein YccC